MSKSKQRPRKIKLPKKDASYAELADFLDRTDATDLIAAGIVELDSGKGEIDRLLDQYWRRQTQRS